MRRILIDHARQRSRDKRGGGIMFTTLDGEQVGSGPNIDILALDEALHRLDWTWAKAWLYQQLGGL